MGEIIWQPSAERIAAAQVTGFRRQAAAWFDRDLPDWDALYLWSITQRDEFWEAVWRFTAVVGERGDGPVVEDEGAMEKARWFTGARLNFAENLLRRRDASCALIFRGENGLRRQLSWAELYVEVARVVRALRTAGVEPGDRVAGFLPNLPETVIAMLGTAAVGAVWSSCSPDFGVQGVLDRFGQIAPKILITTDGYFYSGVCHDSLAVAAQLQRELPDLSELIVVPYTHAEPDLSLLPGARSWPDFLGPVGDGDQAIEFVRLRFDHPLLIMYSSGTTGLPKCMVHSAGGTLLQHVKEHRLHCDLRPHDRLFYYTTCGWMMWNWLVSGLASEATLVLYDGAAMYPDPVLWELAAAEEVAIFGTSARYLAAAQKRGLTPGTGYDLAPLRAILSTGSPLAPESFDYVYRDIKADVLLGSISGGTDIVSCFALCSPVLPLRRGELQCRGLGMAVEVWDETGQALVGQKGELVCTKPFPSQPTSFWNDPAGARYHEAYFARFPGVWHHGDYAELRPEGGVIIHGRSDAVLNPGGVRIGTAEIYRVVEKFDEVLESVVVGQNWRDDVRIVLFVRLQDGLTLNEELRNRIRQRIRKEETPRHVPAKIIQVEQIPHTISGKIVELAVRKMIHGQPIENREALANPAALDLYRDLSELQEG